MKYLLRPFEEYIRCNAEVFVGTKYLTTTKCFLWLPEMINAESHLYLYLEKYDKYEWINTLIENDELQSINVKISITLIDGKTPYEFHVIKEAHFSEANATFVAENWFEAFIMYTFCKRVITKTYVNNTKNFENKFRFFVSTSELLTSKAVAIKHFTGEIQRDVINGLHIENISHLGLASINTDKYVGENEKNVLEVVPSQNIKSILSFYKHIQPIVDLILNLTSLAERRRLNWYKCDGVIDNYYIENYNTRIHFHDDKETIKLISRSSFQDFLNRALTQLKLEDIDYTIKLLRSYLSGWEYSMDSKIILWSSVLENVLKRKFNKKGDKEKADLLRKMQVYISDLPSIKNLADIRNQIAHGDEVNFNELIELSQAWHTLIERVLLHEVHWHDLSKTDVQVRGGTKLHDL